MNTLLERARKLGKMRGSRVVTKQEIDLALGWASGEIGIAQVTRALKIKGYVNAYVRLAIALRAHLQKKS